MGHNIYILCHQLSHHNRDLQLLLRQTESLDTKMSRALEYYRTHTAQIEVRLGGRFPNLWLYLI